MNLSSGGLAIVAIGAIWFLVFLPSFIRGDKNKEVSKPVIRDKAPRIETPGALSQAKKARNVSATVAAASFVVLALSALQLATSGAGLPLTLAVLAIFTFFAWLAVRNQRTLKNLTAPKTSRNFNYSSPEKAAAKTENNSRSFTPDNVPSQNFLRTGAIEIVELAQVVSLEELKTSTEIDNIDEILRRRRHIG